MLIDRGFVPDAFRDPASRPQGELTDAVTVTGLAGPPETQGVFIPNNEPERNRWFWRDLAAMAQSMFGSSAPLWHLFSSRRSGAISPAVGLWAARPGSISPTTICNMPSPGFSLALCLVVIYVIYVRSRLRAA